MRQTTGFTSKLSKSHDGHLITYLNTLPQFARAAKVWLVECVLVSVRQIQLFDDRLEAFEKLLVVGVDGLNGDSLALHLVHRVANVFKEFVVLVEPSDQSAQKQNQVGISVNVVNSNRTDWGTGAGEGEGISRLEADNGNG